MDLFFNYLPLIYLQQQKAQSWETNLFCLLKKKKLPDFSLNKKKIIADIKKTTQTQQMNTNLHDFYIKKDDPKPLVTPHSIDF